MEPEPDTAGRRLAELTTRVQRWAEERQDSRLPGPKYIALEAQLGLLLEIAETADLFNTPQERFTARLMRTQLRRCLCALVADLGPERGVVEPLYPLGAIESYVATLAARAGRIGLRGAS